MKSNLKLDRYGVMGDPIGHSKSPIIHQQFAEQTGELLCYEALHVAAEDFDTAVTAFFDGGGKGLNITVPHKERAFQKAEVLTERASLAEAVNTLYLNASGQLCGDNTDGAGLVRDLKENQSITIADASVLLLGAGGAARGVLLPLLNEGVSAITIANRTAAKAVRLAEKFSVYSLVNGCGYDALSDAKFDVVINATSAGLSGEVPPIAQSLVLGTSCYDMVYGNEPTAFLRWARAAGCANAVDGLGMLVEQAAESFFIWRNVRPDTLPVMANLRG